VTLIVSNSGVAANIVVRRQGFATWLEIDGVMIGLHPHSAVTVDVDPDDTPYIYLRLYANRIYVDNCATAPPDGQGVDHVEAEGEEAPQAPGLSVRLPEDAEVPDL
jgi:hypothetical protein